MSILALSCSIILKKNMVIALILLTLLLIYVCTIMEHEEHISHWSAAFRMKLNAFGIKVSKSVDNSLNKTKIILFWGKLYSGSTLSDYCIQNNNMEFCDKKCIYTTDQSFLHKSDAIVIHGREDESMNLPQHRLSMQRWIFLMFESPDNSFVNISNWENNMFNWTMTYRMDSDVPIPYGSIILKPPSKISTEEANFTLLTLKRLKCINESKKLIAWAVSNCEMVTSERQRLVDQLSKHISVDIYGKCGNKTNYCASVPSHNFCKNPYKCHEYLGSRYKFYLALENSLCKEYITEKFFNSLKCDMVPIVHGPSRKYYENLAPSTSFIHVEDFKSLKLLADYLVFLDKNPLEYLKYFHWRKHFMSDNVYHYQRGWCNLCEKLHLAEDNERKSYYSIHKWWFYEDETIKEKPCKKLNMNENGIFE